MAIYTTDNDSNGEQTMNTYSKITIALLTLMLVGIGTPLALAESNSFEYQYSAGIVSLTTDNIAVKVTGDNQAPHFHWWDPNTPSVDYHVMFVRIFEANDTDGNGVFDNATDQIIGAPFVLPAANWTFSGFNAEGDGDNVTAVNFNFTTTARYNPREETQGKDYGMLPNLPTFDVYIQIRVHLNASTPNEMKFDLIVDGWNWTYQDSILVLQFTISESAHGQLQGDTQPTGFHKTGTMFEFSNGYFGYEPTALAANNSLQVKASYGEGIGHETGESVYLSFQNFGNETLEYDPVIGVQSATSSGVSWTNPMILSLIGGAIVILFAIAIIFKKR